MTLSDSVALIYPIGRLNGVFIRLISTCGGPTAAYALTDLKRCLAAYSPCSFTDAENADTTITLSVDGTLPSHAWRLREADGALTIAGGSESAMLQGVYDALQRMGLCFDPSGEWCRGPLDCGALRGIDETVVPSYIRRGIRQHINFAMDISSYAINEAREYIRRVARTGYNAITFHSYPGQWYGYVEDAKTYSSGNFFYGQWHNLPDDPVLRDTIDNDNVYIIPAAEPLAQDSVRRGEYAQTWLRAVMRQAKICGMEVSLSFEIRGERPETQVQIIRGLIKAYPDIDVLEYISSEGGGDADPIETEALIDKTKALFGEAVTDDLARAIRDEKPGALPGVIAFMEKLQSLLAMGDALYAGLKRPALRVGLYVTEDKTLKIMLPLMRARFPKNIGFSFLSTYGAEAVAVNIAAMNLTKEDWKRTLVYSWAEFDGNMYLQQLSTRGMHTLCDMGRCVDGEAYGIGVNHWRTAENRLTLAYDARAMREPTDPLAFYDLYARSRGLRQTAHFVKAMDELSALDTYNRDNLFNIGFCASFCWLNVRGLKSVRGWKRASLVVSRARYSSILDELGLALSEADGANAFDLIRGFESRCRASISHLDMIDRLIRVAAEADDDAPEAMTQAQKEDARRLLKEADDLARDYMSFHALWMPDRGSQGTLVSYFNTYSPYIERARRYFVTGGDCECLLSPTWDAPPIPDTAAQ